MLNVKGILKRIVSSVGPLKEEKGDCYVLLGLRFEIEYCENRE